MIGRTLSQSDVLGNAAHFAYDNRGNLVSQTDALGAVTSFQYDARNQLISATDALGNVTRFEYDALGELIKTIRPDSAFETWVYDAMGRQIQSIDALGRSMSFAYDAAGNLVRTTDPMGNSTTGQYDALNRKIGETDALGNITTYTYDPLGRITKILDANQNATLMHYDLLGRLVETIYPDGSKETLAYDAGGNVIESKDRKGRVIHLNYDVLNRLTQRLFDDNTQETFTYDAMGNVLTETNAAGTVRNEYDLSGQLTRQIDVFGDILQYTYDARGNEKSLTAFMGSTTLIRNYTYDALGRLTGIKDEKNRNTDYTYDSRSRIVSKVLPNGTKTDYAYDAASQLTTLTYKEGSGNVFRMINYAYDNRGLVAVKNDSFEGASSFAYDKLGELVSITNPILGLVSFVLDALGNRNQVVDDGVSQNYSANSLNEYTQAGNETMQYDAAGNLTQRTNSLNGNITRYQYNVKDQLTQAILPNGKSVWFGYDAMGHRITKATDSGTVRYVWDGNEVLAELDGSGNLLKSYAHGVEIDEVLYEDNAQAGQTLFFHGDALMSTVAISDTAGQMKESYAYDPYGNIIEAKDRAGNNLTSYSTQMLYTGRELDKETGLYYNRARYYDPGLGRFISADPKGYDAGLNLYTYTQNNPLSFRDPEGLDVYWGGGYEGFQPIYIQGPQPSPPEGASRFGSCGSCGGGAAGGGPGPQGPGPSSQSSSNNNLITPEMLAKIGDALAAEMRISSRNFHFLPSSANIPGLNTFRNNFALEYQTFQGIDAGLEKVGSITFGLKVSGPINVQAIVYGMFSGPSGISAANPKRVDFDLITGLSLPVIDFEVGKTGMSGGNKIPAGLFTFSPLIVNQKGDISSSIDINAGTESKGFEFSFGSAGISLSRRRK